MLRLKILVSIVPLAVAGFFARDQLSAAIRPCIATATASVQIAQLPWLAQHRVSFTSDPTAANVRVQIIDSPEMADLTVIDDVETAEAEDCDGAGPTEFIGIAAEPATAPTVIYLSRDGEADYRIFVRSKRFTAREAAALVVGAHGGRQQQVAGAL
ncbi:hypothetical protein [Bradyrhizobium prioriisuperbiae]|uniref:hypothetical protein n=1 Tax=Bradyrhizobium prioriisuperbiae TaxID=2854389 RepID=UPI0028E87BCA|nr:hypothetical protein [Bradyrhizobium prioritasuperba]